MLCLTWPDLGCIADRDNKRNAEGHHQLCLAGGLIGTRGG